MICTPFTGLSSKEGTYQFCSAFLETRTNIALIVTMIPARITAVVLFEPVFGSSGVTVVVVVSGAGVTVVVSVVSPVIRDALSTA